MKYARKRDANEKDIVRALEAAGASVTRLGDPGVPDLLVGYQGATFLLEVKLPLGARGGTSQYREAEGGSGDFTAAQVAWWAAWKGAPALVVRSVAEALDAVAPGVEIHEAAHVGICACGAPILRSGARGPNPRACRACRARKPHRKTA